MSRERTKMHGMEERAIKVKGVIIIIIRRNNFNTFVGAALGEM